jgi:hypothetical protein
VFVESFGNPGHRFAKELYLSCLGCCTIHKFREISVSWRPEEAYRRWVSEFSSWWPSKSHSIGGPRIRQLVFEEKVGGRIYEEHIDTAIPLGKGAGTGRHKP